jgi:hypothetical protein
MQVVSIRAVQCAEYQRQVKQNFNTYLIFKAHQDVKIYDMIYLLTAIGLTPGGSSTVHIYTQTIHRTTKKNKDNI